MKMKSSSVSISDEVSKVNYSFPRCQLVNTSSQYIQDDFVQERQKSGSGVTTDDFIQRMSISRLLALSYGDSDITKDAWEKAKILDRERKQRF